MKQIFSLVVFCSFTFFAIAQEAETAASLYNKGLASMKKKDYAGALNLYKKALSIANPDEDSQVIGLANKNGAIAAYYRGNALSKAKKNDEALAVLQEGLNMNPAFYGNYVTIGSILNKQGEIVKSVESYIKAAEVRTKAGKADKAAGYLKKANNIIAIAFSKKKYDETIEAGKLVAAANENADVHYYLAKAFNEKGQSDDALDHAKKAAEMGVEDQESKYIFNLAELYEANGNNAEAIATYKKVGKGKYFDLAQYKVNKS